MLLRDFFLGSIIGLLFLLTSKLANYLIEKHLRIYSADSIIEYSGRFSFFKETIFISLIFGLLYIINSFFHSFFSLVLLLSIFLSYGFIIKPYIYSYKSKLRDLEIEEKLLNELGIKVKVIIHESHFTNALTFGALPFSNIIVISKDLHQILSEDNLYAIVLHEIGHIKKKHLLFIFAYNLLMTIAFNYLLNRLLTNNDSSLNFFFILSGSCIVFGLCWYFLIAPIMRQFEYRADLYAANTIGFKNYCQAIQSLDSLSNGALTNNDFYHPNLNKRIQNVIKNCAK